MIPSLISTDRSPNCGEQAVLCEQILSVMTDLVIVYDLEKQQCVFTSPGTTTSIGFSKAQLRDMGTEMLFLLMHPDDYSEFRNRICPAYSALPEGQPLSHEFRIRHRDGNWRWMLGKAHVFRRNTAGLPEQVLLVAVDISSRKEQEAQLAATRRHFDQLFSADIIGFSIWHSDGRVLDANDYYLNMLGYTRKELAAGDLRWIDLTPERFAGLDRQAIRSLQETGVCAPYEKTYITKDGREVPVLLGVCSLDESALTGIAYVLDLTMMQEARKTLELSRQVQQIFAAMQDILYLHSVGPDGRIRCDFINDQFTRITGLPTDLLIGKDLDEALHEQPTILRSYRMAIETQAPVEWEENYEFPAGNRSIITRATPIFNSEGRCTHIVGLAKDVTQSRKNQQEKWATELRYRNIFNSTPISIWEQDFSRVREAVDRLREDGIDSIAAYARLHPDFLEHAVDSLVLKDVNDYSVQLFGASSKEQVTTELARLLLPHTLEFFPDVMQAIADRKLYFQSETELQDLQGNRMFVAFTIRFPTETDYSNVLVCIRDITARKNAELDLIRSEDKYRQLFNCSPLPSWVVSVDTDQVLMVNDAAVRHYGYSRNEFLGLRGADLRRSSERKKYLDYIRNHGTNLKGSHGCWRHLTKDGREIDVEIVAHTIRFDAQDACLVIVHDVTEQKRQEAELLQANSDLHALSLHMDTVREEERMNIARDIHDELGQQLTAMKMDTSWLAKKLQQDLILQPRLQSMLHLLDETIGSVRRISANLRPHILDDLGLVAALEWQTEEFQRRYRLPVYFHSEETECEIPFAIRTTLFRVYQEALTNIARHAQATEVESSLRLTGNRVVLEVADNGKGIDPAKPPRKNSFGLIGIRERVYLLGGSYELESAPNKGTRIIASIPLTK